MKTKADLYEEYETLANTRDTIAEHLEFIEVRLMEVKNNISKYKDEA